MNFLAVTFVTVGLLSLSAARAQEPTPAQPTSESTSTNGTDEDPQPAALRDGADDPSQPTSLDDAEQAVGLRTLEERVNALKEKVFRSKARLVLLRETVLNGVISGARAVIRHRNEMGASFTLVRASYALDGEPLLNETDVNGSLDGRSEIELFEGSIVPGTHNLSVQLVYRGNGYGVFTYLKDYKFKIRASYPFTAEEGKIIRVKAVAYERGGITTDLQDRPSVRFETEIKQDIQAAVSEGQGAGTTP